jgi:hypothetical protein
LAGIIKISSLELLISECRRWNAANRKDTPMNKTLTAIALAAALAANTANAHAAQTNASSLPPCSTAPARAPCAADPAAPAAAVAPSAQPGNSADEAFYKGVVWCHIALHASLADCAKKY